MVTQSAGRPSPVEEAQVSNDPNSQSTVGTHAGNEATSANPSLPSARQHDHAATTAHPGAVASPTIATSLSTSSPNGPAASPNLSKSGSDPIRRHQDWLPSTLRWYLLATPMFVSLGLGVSIAVLCWYSDRHHGLGNDDGSSGILFGWRFTPTLIAVLYTQMTVILFEDVKRTEPFARLAKPPAGGATAAGTILHTPKAWWGIFIDAIFHRKKYGKTTWSLLGVALVNVVALLAISPLSSALLTSEEILIPQTVPFTRLKLAGQLPVNMTRNTYFRITSALYGNVSTSAWTSGTSFTLPFWPESEQSQFQPALQSTFRSWIGETTNLRTTLRCQEMSVNSSISRKFYSDARDVPNKVPRNGTQPMVSFVLESRDGCKYELDNHPNVELASYGGVMWSKASEYFFRGGSLFLQSPRGGAVAILANLTATHPYARLRTTKQCDDREIIIMSTPWTDKDSYRPGGDVLLENNTYVQSPDFRMRALLCDPEYYISKRSMSVSVSAKIDSTLENAPGAMDETKMIPEKFFNSSEFQTLIAQDEWNPYVERNLQNRPENETELEPVFVGLGPLLAASGSFNLNTLLSDPQLVERAARIRGRIFAEVLRDAMNSNSAVVDEVVEGQGVTVQERVVVLTEVGVTLATLFFVSFITLLVVLWSSRLSRRPLNLQSDPASTIGMSVLLDGRQSRTTTLKSMHKASKSDLYSALRREKYSTFDSALQTDGSQSSNSNTTSKKQKPKSARDWRPRSIHLSTLIALAFFLLMILVAVVILNAFSARSSLSQLAFTYEADVSRFGLSFKTFAPISIAPTVISVLIGLWWDQLDQTFRILQPYLAMSRSSTPIISGAGLTYRSKTWVGAAVKAAKHKHWLLFAICLGSTLCQVLTVSMSALFERQPKTVVDQIRLDRTLELRQNPLVYHETFDNTTTPLRTPSEPRLMAVLDDVYEDATTNFFLSAAMQLSLNGSRPKWTADEWSFIPLDIGHLPESESVHAPGVGNEQEVKTSPINVTVYTPAIRARIQCDIIEEIRTNTSSWLHEIPDLANDTSLEDMNLTGKGYLLKSLEAGNELLMFEGTPHETFDLISTYDCCQNGTYENPGASVAGYWSRLNTPAWRVMDDLSQSPRANLEEPLGFVVKWIRGKGGRTHHGFGGTVDRLVYKEPPVMQAAHCVPTIETSNAVVTIDKESKGVISYRILGASIPADAAWSEAYVLHEQVNPFGNILERNITTSYGLIFLNAILGASTGGTSSLYKTSIGANTFRDPGHGVNMDLLSYSMYTQAGQDPDLFLNYTRLVSAANTTFQTYFQHFVSNKLSASDGGWAYQKINDKTLEGVGKAVDENGTAIPERVYPVTNTPRNAIALVQRRISILHMNEVATYLSVAILIWLIGTSLAVAVLQRRYTRFMMRNVDSIADVLVLVAGSENLLRLIQERGLALKRDREIRTKLGWFKGKDGEVRWGVEVVGGRDAVQWVDTPTDPNISEKKPGLVRKTTQGLFSVVERVGTGFSRKGTARSP